MGDYITIKKEIMAINVNSVYKSVLSILNKEQRGYVTPDEFNKISRQVQLGLLDQAFTEYNKNLNLQNANLTNEGYADLPTKIEEKIDNFHKEQFITLNSDGVGSLYSDVYKVISLSKDNTDIEKISKNALPYLLSSTLSTPTADFPIYYMSSATAITVNPKTISSPLLKYIKVPKDPRWGYSINATYGTNVYDSYTYEVDGLVVKNNTLASRTAIASGATNGTYTGTVGTTTGYTTNGDGSDAIIRVTVSGNAVSAVDITVSGKEYTVGDTITVASSIIGGSTNLVITITAVDLYSGSTYGSTNFELHPSEEVNLVLGILGYAGLTIKDAAITQLTTQIAGAKEIAKQQ